MNTHRIYLDNAATTPMDPEVIEVMTRGMKDVYGNPSSIHALGRESRSVIEKARKRISGYLNCTPSEIFFTSGGTEADNMAIQTSVSDLGVKHIITSPIEHHAVLHTIQNLSREGKITFSLLDLDKEGKISNDQLEEMLKGKPKTMISLMEANNEIGTLNDINRIGELAAEHNALFHSDTVQTMGHYAHDLQKQKLHFLASAAHKFHGPKGVGFIYIRNTVKVHPFIHGGSQERNMRGGTENLLGIMGLDKAFEIAETHRTRHQESIQALKTYMADRILKEIPDTIMNGAKKPEEGLYTVLNISFPESDLGEMLLFNLDIQGISASGGSACSSGSDQGSHVLTALGVSANRPSVRFSFSKFNTREEIDKTVEVLKKILNP